MYFRCRIQNVYVNNMIPLCKLPNSWITMFQAWYFLWFALLEMQYNPLKIIWLLMKFKINSVQTSFHLVVKDFYSHSCKYIISAFALIEYLIPYKGWHMSIGSWTHACSIYNPCAVAYFDEIYQPVWYTFCLLCTLNICYADTLTYW